MSVNVTRLSKFKPWISCFVCLMLTISLLWLPMMQLHTVAQKVSDLRSQVREKKDPAERPSGDLLTSIPSYEFPAGFTGTDGVSDGLVMVGSDQGSESEPNNSAATADVLTGFEGRITGGNLALGAGTPPTSSAIDPDFYAFTTTAPNSKIFAATNTLVSGGSTDTILAVIASDGTTVLESDDQNGSMGGNSSTIAGTNLATPGTYYLRVTNFSTTNALLNYDLYFAVRSGAPTPETEPNELASPQALPASQFVSGTISSTTDQDVFTLSVNAGDTIMMNVDLDPERDSTTFNARIAIGIFGNPGNLLSVNDDGAETGPDSEAMFITVDSSGTYMVFVDSNGGTGGTYSLNATVIPAPSQGSCTTYSNNTPSALTDAALTSSTITIPDSKVIRSLRVNADITHANIPDLDVHLRSPSNNDNGLFSDIGVSTQTGAQNINLRQEASIPLTFNVLNGPIYRAEGTYRLSWFKGENSAGLWTLDIYDDTVGSTGTLNNWSLEVCEEPALTGGVVYSQDFEADNGGYTHSGTADEWEYGTPATAATNTTDPVAAFNSCASGTKCWKTDLDNTYNASSNQELTSPSISLGGGSQTLYWQARYQIESISFDHAWVRVTEVGNASNTKIVWAADAPTMTEINGVGSAGLLIGASAGWGRYSADISEFANKNIQIGFHLDSDSDLNLGGFAIDDVSIRGSAVATAFPISGRLTSSSGRGIAGAVVTLTEQGGATRVAITSSFGYYQFFEVSTQQNVSISVSSKRYTCPTNAFFLNGAATSNFACTGTP